MLGAYYYLWYGCPTIPVNGAGVWRRGHTNCPTAGEYNSRDEKIINQQIDLAKAAGIDFFAVCWADIESWDDITLRDYYLKNPRSKEIKFCLNYDGIRALNRYGFDSAPSYDLDDPFTPKMTKGEKMVKDFEYFAETYFNKPEYLRINSKPVIIIYNASAYRNISKYFDQIKTNMEKRGISLFLIADVICWGGLKISKKNLSFLWDNPPKEFVKIIYRALRRISPKNYEKDFSLSQYFSAITSYNLYHIHRLKNFLLSIDNLYHRFRQYAKNQNLYFIPNVMPGYDDRNQNGLKRPIIDRRGGEFYKSYWQIIKKHLDPKMPIVMLTTFNEWHEGTEVEPSKEYGDQYIESTKSLKSQILIK